MDWIKTIAPMLGTALAGPLGGAAASMIADKLGLSEKSVEAVTGILQGNSMTPEQVANLKLAEIDFSKFLEENKIKLAQINLDNTRDARGMQIATRSVVPATLAIIVTVGFFGILIGMLAGKLTATDNQALLIMLGALGAAWGAIVNYYFGSSASSAEKNKLLAAKRDE